MFLLIIISSASDFWYTFCLQKNETMIIFRNAAPFPCTPYDTSFILLLTPPDPSLPRQRACSPAEFVQRQTTHYLQEWDIKERRAGPGSACAPLSGPEKPGICHQNCGGNVSEHALVNAPQPPANAGLTLRTGRLPAFL